MSPIRKTQDQNLQKATLDEATTQKKSEELYKLLQKVDITIENPKSLTRKDKWKLVNQLIKAGATPEQCEVIIKVIKRIV